MSSNQNKEKTSQNTIKAPQLTQKPESAELSFEELETLSGGAGACWWNVNQA